MFHMTYVSIHIRIKSYCYIHTVGVHSDKNECTVVLIVLHINVIKSQKHSFKQKFAECTLCNSIKSEKLCNILHMDTSYVVKLEGKVTKWLTGTLG